MANQFSLSNRTIIRIVVYLVIGAVVDLITEQIEKDNLLDCKLSNANDCYGNDVIMLDAR